MNVLQKIGIYLAMALFAAILGGFYGALHDQISYTLSEEYFTRFKFQQFGIPWAFEIPRLGAAYVGFMATWWMGVLLFIPLGFFGFAFPTPKAMAENLAKSLFTVVTAALVTGLLGLFYGYLQINDSTIAANMQWVRPNVSDPVQFVRVGYMHNASYFGGFTGFLSGIAALLVLKRQYQPPKIS